MDLDSTTSDDIEKHDDDDDQEKQHFHVLAVDDSQIDRKLLERLLTFSSYQVTCVDSGDKALEYLGLLDIHEENEYEKSSSTTISCSSSSKSISQQEVSKVNLIMTDYSMPGITGYDLLKRIKDSSWKDIPVVVMSSENVPSRINMCLEGGAEEFLLKPVTLSDLRKLHSHLIHNATTACHPDNNINNILHDNDNNNNNNINISVICNNIENANINKEENNNNVETDKNCSTATNKRKANLAATASDLSDRRPRVQELPVS